MTTSTHSRTIAALLAVSAIAAPLANAESGTPMALKAADLPCAPNCPPGLLASDQRQAAAPIASAPDGFDWPDAAIGFGLGAGALLLAGGSTVVFRRARRPTTAAL